MARHVSDEELMRLAQQGDREAFAALFRRHSGPVLGYFHRLTGRADLSEGLCQETFLRLYERRAQYRFPGPLRPYLYTIARNVLHNERQRKAPMPLATLPEVPTSQTDPAHEAEARDEVERLSGAMERLGFEAREIVVLRHFQALPYEEIAEILREPEGTLRSRYNRALAALGAALKARGRQL